MESRYMDNVKADRYYIQKLRKDLDFIARHMQNVDLYVVYETLKNDIPGLIELLEE